MKHILFVCSQNRLRSPTAEQIFSSREDIEVSSAGTNNDADNPRVAADFYVQNLGFEIAATLDWFVSLSHPDLHGLALDFMARGHPANAAIQIDTPLRVSCWPL